MQRYLFSCFFYFAGITKTMGWMTFFKLITMPGCLYQSNKQLKKNPSPGYQMTSPLWYLYLVPLSKQSMAHTH